MGLNAKWWDAKWRYRIPVDLSVSHFDRRNYGVEAALNFQQILDLAGERGKFDSGSLRVIAYDNRGNILGQLPVAYRGEFNPVHGKEESYLAWFISAKAKEKRHYYIYFDTVGKLLPPPELGPLPPENLVKNSGFEEETAEGLPHNWQLSNPAHFALERFEHTKGKKSLKIFISEENLKDGVTFFTLSQEIDVKSFQGQPILFSCDLFLAQGEPGIPISFELRQFRRDGTEILERAIEPRWLTIELAPRQLVQFYERGRISHQADTLRLELSVRAQLYDVDNGSIKLDAENIFTLFLDNVTIRPGERLAIPFGNKRCYVPGAIPSAPVNKGLEFTGSRRLMFNGRSQGTLTTNKYNPDPHSVHWGVRQGTLEFFFKPYWEMNDSKEHTFLDLTSWARAKWQFRLLKLARDDKISLQIADSEKRLHTLTVPARLKKESWHHIACTWDFDKAVLQIFLDEKCIGRSEPYDAPWPSNSDGFETDAAKSRVPVEPTMPLQLVVGNSEDEEKSAEGVMDELRISDCVRYHEDFKIGEPAEFALDDNTRALFHFEEEKYGIHSGDDQFIKSFLFYEEPPYDDYVTLETNTSSGVFSKSVIISPWPPESLFEKNFVENTLKVYRKRCIFPDERKISYLWKEKKAIIKPGQSLVIDVEGDYPPLTRSLIIEPAREGASLLSPKIIPIGGVDPSSYLTLRETLPVTHLEDEDKALGVFEYALAVTNYYDNKAYETIDGKERPIGRSLIKHLNLYPFHQCGPLNHFLRKLFLAFGLSSNQFYGTGHSFEQVFYNGQWHIFDLAERKYFLDRDYQTPMSLSTVEDDPYMMEKNKETKKKAHLSPHVNRGAIYHFLPARALKGWSVSQRHRYHSMNFVLRPGERVLFNWYNEGRWLDTGPKRSRLPISAMPPHYANGYLIFKPDFSSEASIRAFEIEGKAALAIEEKDGISPGTKGEPLFLTYKLHWPYILVGGHLVTKIWRAREEDSCAIYLSLDEGNTWQEIFRGEKIGVEQVNVGFRDAVKARYDYWLKFELKAANEPKDVRLSDLEIRNEFYHSPLSLPGKLKLGKNSLHFKSLSGDLPAKVTYRWVERHKSHLEVVVNAFSFYTMEEDSNINLYVAKPRKPFLILIDVRGGKGKRKVFLEGLPSRWIIQPKTGEIALSNSQLSFEVTPPADENTPMLRWFDVVLNGGGAERRIRCQIFLTHAALALEAEDAKEIGDGNEIREAADASGRKYLKINGSGSVRYGFETKNGGDYALWVRSRIPNETSDSLCVAVDNEEKRALESKCDTISNSGGSKIFLTYGERYDFWQWYRVGPFKISAGRHDLVVSSEKPGAELDVLLFIPDDRETRELATHILQNWLFMPWAESILLE